jgi:hypothetical protein
MKYMTPELLAHSQSRDDDEAETAMAEWEAAADKYKKRLETIKSRFKPSVKSLLRHYTLHDAKVLAIAVDETPIYSILLELDTPDKHGKYIELEYRLIGSFEVSIEPTRHPILKGHGKPFGKWLYDEFDVLQLVLPDKTKVDVFEHSILFSGGFEVRLLFSNLYFRRIRKLLLPPLPPASKEAEEEFQPPLPV